jgi:hypothetical protein
MTRCTSGHDTWHSTTRKDANPCKEPCTEGSMFCARHKEEALARVRAVSHLQSGTTQSEGRGVASTRPSST